MRLFNKEDKGSAELHKLTGAYAAANKFVNIETEIELATSEIEAKVGKGLIDSVDALYQANSDTDNPKDKLLQLLRLPIAWLAMYHFYKKNVISHEDGGRKNKIGADEKMAWEWQFDRDDKAMYEQYCRTLDALFAYLEESKNEQWNNSEQKKQFSKSIIRSLAEFEKTYPIEHSYYTYLMIQPLVIEIQESRLKSICGDKWGEITADSVASGCVFAKTIAQRVAVLLAVITAVERWSVEIFPQAVARRFTSSEQGNKTSSVATQQEMNWYLNRLKAQANTAIQDLRNELKDKNITEDYSLMPDNDEKNKFFDAGL